LKYPEPWGRKRAQVRVLVACSGMIDRTSGREKVLERDWGKLKMPLKTDV